jgi:hypothetical protein
MGEARCNHTTPGMWASGSFFIMTYSSVDTFVYIVTHTNTGYFDKNIIL